MHIPKSAGTALSNAIRRLPPYQNEAHGWDKSLYGSYNEFETWNSEGRPWLFLSHEEIPRGKDFFFGHVGLSNIKYSYPHAYICTILRNPFCRLLSLWVFWRGKPDGLESIVGTYAKHVYTARGSLEQFLLNKTISPQTDNVTARMLLWPHPLIPLYGFIDDRDIDEIIGLCLEKLKSFDFLDVYENSRWVENFQRWLCHPLKMRVENVTERVAGTYASTMAIELTESCRQLIKDRIKVDQFLWEFVAKEHSLIDSIDNLLNVTVNNSILRFNDVLSGNSL